MDGREGGRVHGREGGREGGWEGGWEGGREGGGDLMANGRRGMHSTHLFGKVEHW